ncbi:hypothetical protein K788_0006452 [Paraburkholderia caribensis MBA4]|uniref:Uncharacterized protein n=1 Tax=Paraburkholderia caribensis MBA4 TaxID=1323664 RepID=A0A0P0RBI5_9BURK|nr:hypothetical protein K788_0006452 [Paraburkholderia caribensis MBA4]
MRIASFAVDGQDRQHATLSLRSLRRRVDGHLQAEADNRAVLTFIDMTVVRPDRCSALATLAVNLLHVCV